jgi:hypothetical protein
VGYMIAMGPCVGCGRLFGFNPELVPSITIKGEREPICLVCVKRVNPMRLKNGLPPIEPLPGAYEPEPEDGPDYEP